jgi:hypothetical protein
VWAKGVREFSTWSFRRRLTIGSFATATHRAETLLANLLDTNSFPGIFSLQQQQQQQQAQQQRQQ